MRGVFRRITIEQKNGKPHEAFRKRATKQKAERHMGRSLQNGVLVVLFIFFALCIFDVFLLPLVTSNHFYPGQKSGKPDLGVRNRSTALAVAESAPS